MEAAVPCKLKTTKSSNQHREVDSDPTNSEKRACIVEAHESTRKRLERTPPKEQEDHTAKKWFKSLSHYDIVHKFIPVL